MLVVDTGPLLATADRDDADHAACRALLEGAEGPLVTTGLVIAEAAYLIDRQLGPLGEAALYDSITDGSLQVENLLDVDWRRIRKLVEHYASLRLGGTDSGHCRSGALGHRSGSHVEPSALLVRPSHVDAFDLVP